MATYNLYVDGVNGNDVSGDGTQGNPWRTIEQAFDAINTSVANIYNIHLSACVYAVVRRVTKWVANNLAVNIIGNGAVITTIPGADGGLSMAGLPTTTVVSVGLSNLQLILGYTGQALFYLNNPADVQAHGSWYSNIAINLTVANIGYKSTTQAVVGMVTALAAQNVTVAGSHTSSPTGSLPIISWSWLDAYDVPHTQYVYSFDMAAIVDQVTGQLVAAVSDTKTFNGFVGSLPTGASSGFNQADWSNDASYVGGTARITSTYIDIATGNSCRVLSKVYEYPDPVFLKALALTTQQEIDSYYPGYNAVVDSTPGSAARTIEFRTSLTPFLAGDSSPAWQEYTRNQNLNEPIKYLQLRLTLTVQGA